MKVLLTGGAGYIGSHTFVALRAAGFEPVIVDAFYNSRRSVLERLATITGAPVICEEGDVRKTEWLEEVFHRHAPAAVVHFAADKAVGESVSNPLKYYDNNLGGTISLLHAMESSERPTLVFSSSATVYGVPKSVPIREDFPRAFTNPYGHTKLVNEDMLSAIGAANPKWRIATLRYFNPVGAHESGLIGEDPHGIPNNLMPFISQVATGRRAHLSVYGNDYPTRDGTGVRDYIHVDDLARGHVSALQALLKPDGTSLTVNLGTGRGYSVLEVIRAFEGASGQRVPYEVAPRRDGDVAECFADPTLAAELLGWRAEHDLARMCTDAWRWQSRNPNGYPE